MQILFTADPKIIGRLIRYFTKRSWLGSARTSHVALRYGGAESNWMVEANERGFWPNWWRKFKQKRKVVFQYEVIGIDPIVLEKLLDEYIDEKIGVPYDDPELIGMLIVVVWYWITGKKIKNPFGIKGWLTCSETAYTFFEKVYKETGIRYFKEQDSKTTFPEELLMQCESNPDKFKLAPLNE
jgi:hypothetical protein